MMRSAIAPSQIRKARTCPDGMADAAEWLFTLWAAAVMGAVIAGSRPQLNLPSSAPLPQRGTA